MTHRPTRADTAARMAQHFEAMNRPETRTNWPLLIGAACMAAASLGGLWWVATRALGVW